MKVVKPFNILSIDGGGIRGVFPAKILEHLESELRAQNNPKKNLYEHFDLICGTSTGGIIAIALALGIPAKEIQDLYLKNASVIFGSKGNLLSRFRYSAHDRQGLEQLIREKFKSNFTNEEPRIHDCKTNICIPIYDLLNGTPSILKTKHHERYIRDYHIPCYQAALATAAAPTYFDPYSASYINLSGVETTFNNKVDGGVVANNPTLIGIIEAQKVFNQPLENIRVLSLGTGHQKYADAAARKKWGLHYWMLKNNKRRLIDLFMQAQSQQIDGLVNILHTGIDKNEKENFVYTRIDIELDETTNIELDETDLKKLQRLVAKADREYQLNGKIIYEKHFQ